MAYDSTMKKSTKAVQTFYEMNSQLQSCLNELLQKECWSIVAGKGTGSIFTLGLGDRIHRKRPIENLHLLKEQRENDSEYGLMVYSSWKLKGENETICDSDSDNSNDGSMVNGLGQLKGKRIKEAKFDGFNQGLLLLFDENYRLQIACDGKELYGAQMRLLSLLPQRICP